MKAKQLLVGATITALAPAEETKSGVRGTLWRIRIITAGDSYNGIEYPLQVLHEARDLFEGLPVIVRPDELHTQNKDTDPNKVNGWVDNVKAVPEGLDGDLNLLESSVVRQRLVEAWDRGKRDLLGISMVVFGTARRERSGGVTKMVATRIVRGESVDLVVHPAAGGRLLSMVNARGAAPEGGADMFEQVLALMEARHPEQHKAIKTRLDGGEEITEKQLLTMFTEAEDAALKAAREAGAGGAGGAGAPNKQQNQNNDPVLAAVLQLAEAIKTGKYQNLGSQNQDQDPPDPEAAARTVLGEQAKLRRLAEARIGKLDKRIGDAVRDEMNATELGVFTEAELDASIERQTRAAKRFGGFEPRVPTQHQAHGADGARGAAVIMTEAETRLLAMQGFFLGEDVKDPTGAVVPRYQSLRRMYTDMTGDEYVSGDLAEARNIGTTIKELAGSKLLAEARDPRARALGNPQLMAAAINTTQLADIFADSLHRALVKFYNEDPQNQWMKVTDIVPLSDFRAKYAIRYGGYGHLATVAQSGAYTAMTSPGDDAETYSPTKKGGTETVTREAILNDDVGVVQRIPRMMAAAAAATINYFVLTTLLRAADGAGVTMADTNKLFSAAHLNIGTVALAESSLKASRTRMRKQYITATANDGSGVNTRRLAIWPSLLFVPIDLENTAEELVAPLDVMQTDSPKQQRRWGMQVVVVPHWTDTNDWYTFCDKSQCSLFEIGFIQGRQEPAIFLQDMPNVGSMFSNDMLTYKIRHEYGGAPVEWRGMDGNIVA